MIVYVPGKTPCLNCQQDVDKFAKGPQTDTRPSIITSAQNIGGLMGDQIRKIVAPLDQYDTPFDEGILNYSRYRKKLYYVTPVKKQKGCGC